MTGRGAPEAQTEHRAGCDCEACEAYTLGIEEGKRLRTADAQPVRDPACTACGVYASDHVEKCGALVCRDAYDCERRRVAKRSASAKDKPLSKMARAWAALTPFRDGVDLIAAAHELDAMFDRVRRETIEELCSASVPPFGPRGDRLPLTHVACKDTEGHVWSLPKPFRHHHVLRVMHDHSARCAEDNHYSQGFLDSAGQYLHRKAAWVNADLHGQIKNGKIIGGVLTSEDLW